MKKTSQGEEKKLYKMNIFSAVGPIFKLWEFFKISELGYRYYLELPGRKKTGTKIKKNKVKGNVFWKDFLVNLTTGKCFCSHQQYLDSL